MSYPQTDFIANTRNSQQPEDYDGAREEQARLYRYPRDKIMALKQIIIMLDTGGYSKLKPRCRGNPSMYRLACSPA